MGVSTTPWWAKRPLTLEDWQERSPEETYQAFTEMFRQHNGIMEHWLDYWYQRMRQADDLALSNYEIAREAARFIAEDWPREWEGNPPLICPGYFGDCTFPEGIDVHDPEHATEKQIITCWILHWTLSVRKGEE